jgi:hypothetical protein
LGDWAVTGPSGLARLGRKLVLAGKLESRIGERKKSSAEGTQL